MEASDHKFCVTFTFSEREFFSFLMYAFSIFFAFTSAVAQYEQVDRKRHNIFWSFAKLHSTWGGDSDLLHFYWGCFSFIGGDSDLLHFYWGCFSFMRGWFRFASLLLGVFQFYEGVIHRLQTGLLLLVSSLHTHQIHTLQVLVWRWNVCLPHVSKQYSLKQSFRSNKPFTGCKGNSNCLMLNNNHTNVKMVLEIYLHSIQMRQQQVLRRPLIQQDQWSVQIQCYSQIMMRQPENTEYRRLRLVKIGGNF